MADDRPGKPVFPPLARQGAGRASGGVQIRSDVFDSTSRSSSSQAPAPSTCVIPMPPSLKGAMFLSRLAALHDPASRSDDDRCRARGEPHSQAPIQPLARPGEPRVTGDGWLPRGRYGCRGSVHHWRPRPRGVRLCGTVGCGHAGRLLPEQVAPGLRADGREPSQSPQPVLPFQTHRPAPVCSPCLAKAPPRPLVVPAGWGAPRGRRCGGLGLDQSAAAQPPATSFSW